MLKQQTIKCAFCQGTGQHPHFTGTCSVCKGKGRNQIRGKITTCRDCYGSGQKNGTALTCYACGGLGVVPDTSEIFTKAKKEIEKARKEMARERGEFREKSQPVLLKKRTMKKVDKKKETEEVGDENEESKRKIFCQCCAKKIKRDSTVKICLSCLRKMKEG